MSWEHVPVGSGNTHLSVARSQQHQGWLPLSNGALSEGVLQSIARLPNAPEVSPSISSEVAKYLDAGLSLSTQRAYRQDVQDFLAWGGSLPAGPGDIAAYLAARARDLAPATLSRRLIGIGWAHTELCFSDPTKDVLVRKVLMGIKRKKGCAQRQVAPLLKEDLLRMLPRMEGVRGLRDRAMLLVGFAAALRRSELAALDFEDVEQVDEGVLLHVRRSKTDQTALGRTIAIPRGAENACPVRALYDWLAGASIQNGAVFRSIDRFGRIAGTRLSVQSIALIVKEHARQIGLDSTCYSGHSLRAGLVTSAIQAGVGIHKIQQQTGHRSLAMVTRYVRDNDLFRSNAAGILF